MAKKKIFFYGVMVYIAYGFFILMGLSWFLISLSGDGHLNYPALSLIAIFAVQAYFRNKVTNLILGIISLMLSIFMLLEVIQTYDLFAKNAVAGVLAKALLLFCFTSIFMSVILIFSYTKLSFKAQE